MQSREIVLALMKEKGVTQTKMAELMGYSNQSGVRARLCRPGEAEARDLSVDTLLRFLDVLGYDLIIREKDKKRGAEYVVSK